MVEEFRVIFWNVWASNQAQQARLDLLCARLGELIEVYSPDVFGLNEVVFDEEVGWSQVVRYLETRGYQVHFVPHGPEGLGMLAGSALATRSMPQRVLEPVLGPIRRIMPDTGAIDFSPLVLILLLQILLIILSSIPY